MVDINMEYLGDLEVEATHGPSGVKVKTDAPIDNNGKGRSFSPTDLAATALGACMVTIMGIVAARHDIDLKGMKIKVIKEMASQPTRRIGKLTVDFEIPSVPEDKRSLLEKAALSCPVHHSLHPDIEIVSNFKWGS